jgi:hypothetical protein
MLSLFVSDREVRKIVTPDYRPALPWVIAFIPPLFIVTVGLPFGLLLLAPTVFVLTTPAPRRQLSGYAELVRSRLRRPATA